ncbi:MAG: hypothetical protein MUF06_21000 [Pirellulaceae bacterium]|nr:hypothetical protein [Pirellulaceae bacterium]
MRNLKSMAAVIAGTLLGLGSSPAALLAGGPACAAPSCAVPTRAAPTCAAPGCAAPVCGAGEFAAAGGYCDVCGHGGAGGAGRRGARFEGLDPYFNCGCNGSYKFPVPPLYTYHWPGLYSAQLMTDYHSPWRFPPLKPYVDEVPPVEMGSLGTRSVLRPVSATFEIDERRSGEMESVRRVGEMESMSSKMLRMGR